MCKEPQRRMSSHCYHQYDDHFHINDQRSPSISATSGGGRFPYCGGVLVTEQHVVSNIIIIIIIILYHQMIFIIIIMIRRWSFPILWRSPCH